MAWGGMCVYCRCVCTCLGTCVEGRADSLLPPCGPGGLNLGRQAWYQAPLPTQTALLLWKLCKYISLDDSAFPSQRQTGLCHRICSQTVGFGASTTHQVPDSVTALPVINCCLPLSRQSPPALGLHELDLLCSSWAPTVSGWPQCALWQSALHQWPRWPWGFSASASPACGTS